jgi:cell wall-associated NlpC family hydrolase
VNTRRPVLALLGLLLVSVTGITACQPVPIERAESPGETASAAARQQLGQPYVWGGESRSEGGFDCSGLTSYAWKQAGVSLPRTTREQYSQTRRIDKSDLRPGDLVFYAASGSISHVAIYVGNGRIIQAQKPGVPVNEQSIDWWASNRVGFGRVAS